MTFFVFLAAFVPAVLLLTAIPFLLLTNAGYFVRKTFPPVETFGRYAVLIPARNEESVIGDAIESIRRAEHGDKIDIFVAAHNCTDRTARLAADAGAAVLEVQNPAEKTKGFALRALVADLQKKGLLQNYDGFFIFDADNLVSKTYFSKMNDAFCYYGKKNPVCGYRNSRNFGENLISSLYGVYLLVNTCIENRARTVFGISSVIRGTGYLLPTHCLKNGWEYCTLTEDWELSAALILQNTSIMYCDEAEFFDEQPTRILVMLRQRKRWAAGHWIVVKQSFLRSVAALFRRGEKGIRTRLSLYCLVSALNPVCSALTANSVLMFLVSLCSALLGASLGEWLKIWFAENLVPILLFCFWCLFSAARVFFSERKRIRNVGLFLKIMTVLAYPIFYLLVFPLQWAAFLSRKNAWETVPHSSHDRPDMEE